MKTTLGSKSESNAGKNIGRGNNYSEAKSESFAMGQKTGGTNPSMKKETVEAKMGSHAFEHQSKSLGLKEKLSPAEGY